MVKTASRLLPVIVAVSLGCGATLLSTRAEANHPVLVEGNNAADGGPGTTSVPPGTGGDYDGDGRIGAAEDTDNANDRIFGTLTAALLAAPSGTGANANGHVIIVTSGRFAEQIRIPNADGGQPALNGVTIIEAAPGVQANIDAVVQGAAGNADRQAGPGVVIDTDQTDRAVILRNLVIRNFSVGLLIRRNARVTAENCRFDSNVEANVRVQDSARLTMTKCSINAGGMRFPTPGAAGGLGHGIHLLGNANASIEHSTISMNKGAGIFNATFNYIRINENNLFDNSPNLAGRFTSFDD